MSRNFNLQCIKNNEGPLRSTRTHFSYFNFCLFCPFSSNPLKPFRAKTRGGAGRAMTDGDVDGGDGEARAGQR